MSGGSVRTLAAPVTVEIPKVQGSRFVAAASPVGDEVAIGAFVAERRSVHRAADHHGVAWRLGAGPDRWRTEDDGEPAGSTGAPILGQIDARGLSDLVVVVSRYFGGRKLGIGGLARAYGGAAGAALDAAEILVRPVVVPLEVRYAHRDVGVIHRTLRAFGLEPTSRTYDAGARLTIDVPKERMAALRAALADATRGRTVVREAAPDGRRPPVKLV